MSKTYETVIYFSDKDLLRMRGRCRQRVIDDLNYVLTKYLDELALGKKEAVSLKITIVKKSYE